MSAGTGPAGPLLAGRATVEWVTKDDVILYDRLASDKLLPPASPAAELVCVGKDHVGQAATAGRLKMERFHDPEGVLS